MPIFRVHDAESALSWYRRLGFEVIGKHQFEAGFPLYVFLQRGVVHLHLSEHTGDAPRDRSLTSTSRPSMTWPPSSVL